MFFEDISQLSAGFPGSDDIIYDQHMPRVNVSLHGKSGTQIAAALTGIKAGLIGR
jgi:hypothetical protein